VTCASTFTNFSQIKFREEEEAGHKVRTFFIIELGQYAKYKLFPNVQAAIPLRGFGRP
jgi:hypothetical protein